MRAVDERGDGVSDYFIEIGTIKDSKFKPLDDFDMDVHAYRDDESYRCFHVDLDRLKPESLTAIALRVIASSGTELVGYHGYNSSSSLTAEERQAE